MEPVILRGEVPSSGDGYGYGYGDGSGAGYGYGDGYGDGYGYGDGDGYGSGYGYGYGDGDGSGSGSGYGDGYGDGYGYGYGDGSGAGYGSGSKAYWLATIPHFASKWTDAQRARLDDLSKGGATLAFWRSDKKGLPANGGRQNANVAPAAPGIIHTAPGPLNLCESGTLHATLLPPKWQGERWWIVALTGEVIGDEEKYGALNREILGEAL